MTGAEPATWDSVHHTVPMQCVICASYLHLQWRPGSFAERWVKTSIVFERIPSIYMKPSIYQLMASHKTLALIHSIERSDWEKSVLHVDKPSSSLIQTGLMTVRPMCLGFYQLRYIGLTRYQSIPRETTSTFRSWPLRSKPQGISSPQSVDRSGCSRTVADSCGIRRLPSNTRLSRCI